MPLFLLSVSTLASTPLSLPSIRSLSTTQLAAWALSLGLCSAFLTQQPCTGQCRVPLSSASVTLELHSPSWGGSHWISGTGMIRNCQMEVTEPS